MSQIMHITEHESKIHLRNGIKAHKELKFTEAIGHYQKAHELAPEAQDPLMGLSNMYLVTRQFQFARDALVLALERDNGHNREYILRHLAFAYRELGDYEAAKHFLNCCKPTYGVELEKAILLPAVYKSTTDAVDHYFALHDRLDKMKIDPKQDGCDLIFTPFYFAYLGALDDHKLMHKIYKKLRPLYPAKMPWSARLKGKSFKRIGFVSNYFQNHSVGRCFVGLFEHIKANHPDIELVTFFGPENGDDEVTARIKRSSNGGWIRLPNNLNEARKLISQSGVQLLTYSDLGMDVFTWLLALTRCAPKQAVLAGHPVSPGFETIDYFISSNLLQTPDQQSQHLEKLVLLDGLITNYDRPQYNLKPREDVMPNGKRVYVCPATLFKVHPDMDVMIKRLLDNDKDAVLMFFKFGDTDMHIKLMQRWHSQFPEHCDRIWFRPWSNQDGFMSVLHHATAIIDTPWFGAGNTSYQSLAAGAPIVCCHNPEMASMKNASTQAHYRQMGQAYYDKYVASTLEEQADKLMAVNEKLTAEETDVLFNNLSGVDAFAQWIKGEDQK